MLRAAAVLAALAATVSSVTANADFCDDSYECRFYYETAHTLWKFDLSPLCSATGYAFQDTENTVLNDTMHFNFCGYSPMQCIAPGRNVKVTQGVAIQSWGEVPDCATTKCTDPQTGQETCCTASSCEVLGLDAPEFRIVDKQNPKTGGILVHHASVPYELADANPCPVDATLGTLGFRNVTYHMTCNPDVVLKWIDSEEGPTCSYHYLMESKYACGVVYSGPGSAASRNGLVAGMFFLGAGLAVLAILGYWWYTSRKGSGSYFRFGSGNSASGATAAPAPATYGGSSSSTTSAKMGSSSYSAVGSS